MRGQDRPARATPTAFVWFVGAATIVGVVLAGFRFRPRPDEVRVEVRPPDSVWIRVDGSVRRIDAFYRSPGGELIRFIQTLVEDGTYNLFMPVMPRASSETAEATFPWAVDATYVEVVTATYVETGERVVAGGCEWLRLAKREK